ncbi:MAG: hypothetical protein NT075_28285, partial [Chloroflexi bacterium]|nr:hypothetical protein [Chloroflexota bacterium]
LYTAGMNPNPVKYGTLIIRSQVEYSVRTQETIWRYMMTMPATGQQRGFTDLDTLLAAVCTELLALQHQVTPPDQTPEDS